MKYEYIVVKDRREINLTYDKDKELPLESRKMWRDEI